MDKPDKPTTDARLVELIGKFEEGTTGGSFPLTPDDIGDVYAWLEWAQEVGSVKPEGKPYD